MTEIAETKKSAQSSPSDKTGELRCRMITRYLQSTNLKVVEPAKSTAGAGADAGAAATVVDVPQSFDRSALIRGMVAAVSGFHSKNVIHRNIRPESFRLAKTGTDGSEQTVVLTGLDHAVMTRFFSKFKREGSDLYQNPVWGPECPDFMDAETGTIVCDTSRYGYEYDMWCLGLCVIRVLYPDVSIPPVRIGRDAWEKFVADTVSRDSKVAGHNAFRPMVSHMLRWNPADRMFAYAAQNMCDIKSGDIRERQDYDVSSGDRGFSRLGHIVGACGRGLAQCLHLAVSEKTFGKFYESAIAYRSDKDMSPASLKPAIWSVSRGAFGYMLVRVLGPVFRYKEGGGSNHLLFIDSGVFTRTETMLEDCSVDRYRLNCIILGFYMTYILFNDDQPADLYGVHGWSVLCKKIDEYIRANPEIYRDVLPDILAEAEAKLAEERKEDGKKR